MNKLQNIPELKIAVVAVSRDCFPMSLSEERRKAVVKAYTEKYGTDTVYECPVVIENEIDMRKALADIQAAECNALCVYLGNFGPETPETLLAKYFDGPAMFAAAAEDDCGDALINTRGDAYCGMLKASYNLKLRNIKAYIPEYPVGTAPEVADMINGFVPIARTVIGLKNLKIMTFGPRPQDFLACNAPIARLYDLGVEVEENSELDLFEAYNNHKDDPRIPEVIADMEKELGEGNKMAGILPRLAQYELTLLDWAEAHKGERKFVA
ncbi:MAG: fucose isomerase, partial [Oscillospiraceae bacterium]|nr:fucose isomerase [Oscillospiraceae bacterium]